MKNAFVSKLLLVLAFAKVSELRPYDYVEPPTPSVQYGISDVSSISNGPGMPDVIGQGTTEESGVNQPKEDRMNPSTTQEDSLATVAVENAEGKIQTLHLTVFPKFEAVAQQLGNEFRGATRELASEFRGATRELATEFRGATRELATEVKEATRELATAFKEGTRELVVAVSQLANNVILGFCFMTLCLCVTGYFMHRLNYQLIKQYIELQGQKNLLGNRK